MSELPSTNQVNDGTAPSDDNAPVGHEQKSLRARYTANLASIFS